jgi:hypothetical protein
MDAANMYYQRANSGRYSGKQSGGSSSKGAISALETVGKVEDTVTSWFPGDDDKRKVREGFQHLLNLKLENGKKISPQLAAAAIDYGKENNLFMDDFPDLGSPEFAEIQYMAELMAGGGSSNGSFIRPRRSEFRYRDVNPRTVDDILFQELAGRTPLRGKVPVSEGFSRDLLNYQKAKPLNRTPQIPGFQKQDNIKLPSPVADTTVNDVKDTKGKKGLEVPKVITDRRRDRRREAARRSFGGSFGDIPMTSEKDRKAIAAWELKKAKETVAQLQKEYDDLQKIPYWKSSMWQNARRGMVSRNLRSAKKSLAEMQ